MSLYLRVKRIVNSCVGGAAVRAAPRAPCSYPRPADLSLGLAPQRSRSATLTLPPSKRCYSESGRTNNSSCSSREYRAEISSGALRAIRTLHVTARRMRAWPSGGFAVVVCPLLAAPAPAGPQGPRRSRLGRAAGDSHGPGRVSPLGLRHRKTAVF